MSDGLATAALIFLIPLVLIAAGAWFWINRPQHNEHDPTPRVQPLFGSDLVASMNADVAYDEDDDFVDDEDPAGPSAGQTQVPAASAAHTFAPRPTSDSGAANAAAAHAPAAKAPARDTPVRTPIAREPMPRESMQREPVQIPREAMPREAMSREPVARRAPLVEPRRDIGAAAPALTGAPRAAVPPTRAAAAQQAWADGQAVRFRPERVSCRAAVALIA